MAVASVQEFDVGPDDRSTTNYDAITARLRELGPPQGLILHTAGFTPDNVFRVFTVWESADDAQRFEDERLMPTLRSIAGHFETAAPPARDYTYELHDLQRGQ